MGISPFKNKFKSYQKKLGIKQNLLNFINNNQFVVNFDDLATLSLLEKDSDNNYLLVKDESKIQL